MSNLRFGRLAGTTVAVVGVAALAVSSAAAPVPGDLAAPKSISASGVGGVTLGKTYKRLRQQRLVKRISKGCELGGPNTRSARLRAPLKGLVNFTQQSPRKVTDITVTGGAKARGVGIGAKIPAIKAAYPKAKVDHSTDQVFALTLVKIPKNGGGRLQFGVSTNTKKVTIIGIPLIAFCE